MTTNKGLQVWLPLNGTLENKGLVKSTITSNGVSWSNFGKIGKCFDNSDRKNRWILLQNAFPAHDTDHTVCFWVKSLPNIAAYDDYGYIYTTSNVNGTDAAKCAIDVSTTNGYIISDSCPNFIVTVNDRTQWNHITIVTTKTKVVVYVNGQYSNEQTRNATIASSATRHIAISRNSTGSEATWNMRGSINDFRVYSYALSPQEIKELSRGKVGHWLGDGNGTSLPNLITGNYSIFKTSTGEIETGTISSIPAATILANKGKTLCFSMRKYSKGARTNGISSTLGARFGIHWGCRYTRSGKDSQQDYPMASFLTDASDGIVYCTWTIPSDLVSVEFDLYPSIQTHGSNYARPTDAGVTWYITDVKLEWGTIPSLYSTSNQAFLSDISGFGRHGQVVGDVTLAEDTPRYDKSLKYNGGNIVVTGLPTMSTYTISWWDKFPADTGQLFDWRLGPVNTSMDSSSAGAMINNNMCQFKIGGVATDPQNYSNYGITANTWYHCCLVCDDNKSRLYINGIQKWEASKGSIADFSQLILGGRNAAANDGYQYTGQHSDFRIYATALSADDVKELYSLGH